MLRAFVIFFHKIVQLEFPLSLNLIHQQQTVFNSCPVAIDFLGWELRVGLSEVLDMAYQQGADDYVNKYYSI